MEGRSSEAAPLDSAGVPMTGFKDCRLGALKSALGVNIL